MNFDHIPPRLKKFAEQGKEFSTGPRDGWTPEMLAKKEKALGPNPYAGFNHDDLGCEFFRVGLWERAISEFEQAVSLNPWKAIFKFHLTRAYLAAKMVEKAERIAEALQAQAPSLPEAALAMGLIREKRGDRLQARTWYERCLILKPDYWIKKEAEESLASLQRLELNADLNHHSQDLRRMSSPSPRVA